jgi:hypothetical protein
MAQAFDQDLAQRGFLLQTAGFIGSIRLPEVPEVRTCLQVRPFALESRGDCMPGIAAKGDAVFIVGRAFVAAVQGIDWRLKIGKQRLKKKR